MQHFLTRELMAHRKRALRAVERGRNPDRAQALVERIDAEIAHRRSRRMERLHEAAPALPGLLPEPSVSDTQQRVATQQTPEAAELRERWRRLVEHDLPAVAQARGFPVHLDHCFARILLDCAFNRPWRECIAPPAWRNTPIETLKRAIGLGNDVLSGAVDLHALNRRSLALRGKARGG